MSGGAWTAPDGPPQQPYGQPAYPQQPYPPQVDPGPPYAPGGGRQRGFVTVDLLGTWVVVVSALLLALQVALAVSGWSAGSYYAGLPEGMPPDLVGFRAYDAVVLLGFPVYVAAFVVTSVWLFTIRTNVDQVDRPAQRRGKVWAWLGWVVPIVSLWFPLQVVADAARTSRTPRLPLGLWWASWLVANIATNAANSVIPVDGSVPDPDTAGLLGPLQAVAAAFFGLSFVFWVRIVRELTAAQRRLAAGADAPSPSL